MPAVWQRTITVPASIWKLRGRVISRAGAQAIARSCAPAARIAIACACACASAACRFRNAARGPAGNPLSTAARDMAPSARLPLAANLRRKVNYACGLRLRVIPHIWHHLSSLATKGVFGRASRLEFRGFRPDAASDNDNANDNGNGFGFSFGLGLGLGLGFPPPAPSLSPCSAME